MQFPTIKRGVLQTLQVNLGYRCNQACKHCHVNAGPKRTETMDKATIDTILAILAAQPNLSLDLTGGAPELNPHFRYLVSQARALGIEVTDRCNLTILFEAEQQGLAEFLTEQKVIIVASLPCYLEDNVNKQRGKDVFQKSIKALQLLNKKGYGQADSGLILNLVFNPQGATLPPNEKVLEQQYKDYLLEHFGIVFNQLFALTNQPIQRFKRYLKNQGQLDDYMQLLQDSYSVCNVEQLMCKSLISVDYNGKLYDCDFNQMLHYPVQGQAQHINDLLQHNINNNPIITDQHCFACTAGQGSSCGGSLV